jgi:hypothetical protein
MNRKYRSNHELKSIQVYKWTSNGMLKTPIAFLRKENAAPRRKKVVSSRAIVIFLDEWENSVTATLLHTLGSLSPPVPGTSTLEILLPSLSPVTGSTEWTVVP